MDFFDIDQGVVLESVQEREAREIRTQQNELAHIARLPPEILAEIFVRCVPKSIRKLQTDVTWLNVTQVSSRWRSVALACPDFWSTLVFSRPKLTTLLLARSRMASLVVRVDLKKDYENSPEPILLAHASRLGTLDIRSPQHQLVTFMTNLEHADAASRLQYIRVVNADNDNLGQGGMWLPRNLFRRDQVLQSRKPGACPALRLHLESCAFPWDSGWYTYLTHLHLENINPTQRPTMEAFLTMLVSSPSIQSISIIHCSPTTRRGFPVRLPRLASFTLKSDSSSTCGRLLGYLIIPSSATVSVTCNMKTNPDFRHSIHHTLIPEFSDVAADWFDTVAIHHSDGLSFSLSHSARPEWSRKLRIDATSWTPTNVLRVTESVRDSLDFTKVTTLHLQGMQHLLPPSDSGALFLWDTMGRCMAHVRTLHLHGSFPGSWLEFLLTQAMLLVGVSHFQSCFSRHHLAFRDPDGRLTHAWPALRCLALREIDMGECYKGQLEPTYADLLRALLWARREGGSPIWRLEIEDCKNVNMQDLAYLRLFSDVMYDNKGLTTVQKDDEEESLHSYSVNIFANMIQHAR
ncbi:hypothetical protein GGX14DRAFT_557030 [Mycena pura]|uniref:F-box domain-containing protein n=1 Tax=Mycena pura TaxID=153505 RepID=A0AAD7E2G5_9AGAR|nr:hypothetical protein GGX14DRAFT_557030 [Mycena pura]